MNLDAAYKATCRYFEAGCLCIFHGKLALVPTPSHSVDAADYYMDNCKCSRHPEYPANIRQDDVEVK